MDVLAGQLSSNASAGASAEEDAPIEWLEYDFVKTCTSKAELQRVLKTLQSGKHGKYEHLERTVEEKLLSVMTPQERSIYIAMNHEPTWRDQLDARNELHSWLAQAQEKSRADLGKAMHNLPPARGQAKQAESPQPAQSVSTSSAQSASAGAGSSASGSSASHGAQAKRDSKAEPFSQYYDRWAKVDVDAEISKMEEEETKKAAAAAESARLAQAQALEKRTAELKKLKLVAQEVDKLPPAQRSMLAEKEKIKGNESFKAGEYDEAILYYGRALAYEGTKSQAAAVLFTNRAQARLKNKSFAAAEEDCDAALAIDASLVKAWTRRGTARLRRGNAQGAVPDLKRALQLSQGNEAGAAEIKRLLVEAEGKSELGSGQAAAGTAEGNVTEEIVDPFAKKAGRKKIVIDDGGSAPSAVAAPSSNARPAPTSDAAPAAGTAGKGKARRVIIEEDEEEGTQPAPAPAPAPTPAAAVPATRKKIIIEEESSDSVAASTTPVPAAAPAQAAAAVHAATVRAASSPAAVQPAKQPSAAVAAAPTPSAPSSESADDLKKQGNELVAQGKYTEAVDCYSRSLALHPRNPAVLANRAQARLSLQQYSSASLDCTMALEACHVTPAMVASLAACTHKSTSDDAAATAIDAVRSAAGSDLPLALKALYRRSKAQRAQGKLQDALTDLAAGLALEPNNTSVGKDYAEVKALVKSMPQASAAAASASPAAASSPIQASSGKAAASSSSSVQPSPLPMPVPVPVPVPVAGSKAGQGSTPVKEPAASASHQMPAASSTPTSKAPNTSSTPVSAVSAPVASPPSVRAGSGKTDAAAASSPSSAAPATPTSTQKAAVAVAAAAIAKASTSSPSLAGKVYPTPKTVLELENALIGLKRNQAGLAHYVRSLNGSVLKSIGQRRTIEPDSIEAILHTMERMCPAAADGAEDGGASARIATKDDAAWATDLLEGLTSTHGWETACAMLGSSEFSAIEGVLATVAKVGGVADARLAAVRKACQQ